MQLVKIFVFFVLFSLKCTHLVAQTKFSTINVSNNDTVIKDILNLKNGKSVIFFYPTAKIKKEDFELYSNELRANLEKKKIDSLNVYFVYFKQDLKNNSKGIKICNDVSDTLVVNYMKCFFVGFDSTKLLRAKNKMSLNFDLSKPKKNTKNNIYNVVLEDTNVCIDLVKKIPFYEEIISESINPKYSTDEKLIQLFESIAILQKQYLLHENEIENLKQIITEQNKIIELLKVQSETSSNNFNNGKKGKKN